MKCCVTDQRISGSGVMVMVLAPLVGYEARQRLNCSSVIVGFGQSTHRGQL